MNLREELQKFSKTKKPEVNLHSLIEYLKLCAKDSGKNYTNLNGSETVCRTSEGNIVWDIDLRLSVIKGLRNMGLTVTQRSKNRSTYLEIRWD